MDRATLKLLAGAFAVLLLAGLSVAGEPAAKTEDLRVYEFDIFGPTAEAAMKQAGLHAVRSAVGEFYLGDEMLLARSLLRRYLENYYDRFIKSAKVLSRRESQNMVYLRVSFVIDRGALERDLRQKRFFYKPRRRPFIYVTIRETVDGQVTSGEPISRTAVHQGLSELLMRYEPRVIFGNAANVDVSQDEQLLIRARQAAQRTGVEVILTGRVDLKKSAAKKIHFDEYTFYDARATLFLIRVDDGKILESATYEASAGHIDPNQSKRVAASRATRKILHDIIPRFAERWERTMTDNVDFQVMVAGVNESEAQIIKERLQARLKDVEVYRRSFFEDVVVFNLYYPPEKVRPDERERIEQVLRDLVSPRLRVVPTRKANQVCARRVS